MLFIERYTSTLNGHFDKWYAELVEALSDRSALNPF